MAFFFLPHTKNPNKVITRMIDDARPHSGLPAASAAMIEISMQPTNTTKRHPAAKILIVIYQLCSTILVEAYPVNYPCGFGTHSVVGTHTK